MLRQRITDHLTTFLRPSALTRLESHFDSEKRADQRPADRRLAYGVAWAGSTEFPDGPMLDPDAAKTAVVGLFDLLCDYQGADGWWLWHVVNQGGKIFPQAYPFAMVSLLSTRRDFEGLFDAARLKRIDSMFRRAIVRHIPIGQAYLDTGRRSLGLNIMAAIMSALWVGGDLLGEPEWKTLARKTLHKVIAQQDSAGYWPDDTTFNGPATLYNTVTLSHLAEYAVASEDPVAVESIVKSAKYHRAMVYPDGSLVETGDERNRTHIGAVPALIVAYALFAETRDLAAEYAGLLGQKGVGGLSPQEMDLYGTFPDALWIDAWRRTPEETKAVTRPDVLRSTFAGIPAVIDRSKPWQVCFSGSLRKAGPARRYHYDLQNHLSVWHDQAGVILGGGNSLLDPYFSTFRFGGTYLADDSKLSADGVGLDLQYGPVAASIRTNVLDGRRIEIIAQAVGPLHADSVVALHLPKAMGKNVEIEGHQQAIGENAVYTDTTNAVIVGAVKVTCDRQMRLSWPCAPVNIYDPPRRENGEAVFRISANLNTGPVRYVLEVI